MKKYATVTKWIETMGAMCDIGFPCKLLAYNVVSNRIDDNAFEVIIDVDDVATHFGEGLNTALSGTGVTAKFIEYYCKKYSLPIPYVVEDKEESWEDDF